MKKIKRLIIVLVLLVIVVVAGTLLYIDRIARIGVEQGGTFALGVDTTLQSMDIGILAGSVGMEQLNVANPSGFQTDHFLRLGNGFVAVSLGSLMSDTVVVPELTFEAISMNLERQAGKANYQVIMGNLQKLQGPAEEKPAEPAPATQEQAPGKKFVVQKISIKDINVTVALLPVGGTATRVPVHIDAIEMENIGSETGGVQLAQLSGIIVKAIMESVASKAGNLLPPEILNELNNGLAGLQNIGTTSLKVVGDVTTMVDGQVKKVGELSAEAVQKLQGAGQAIGEGLQQAGESATKSLEGAGQGLQDAGKNLQEGIGNLLGGNKEEKKE